MSRIFDKFGNYVRESDVLGRQMDSLLSPILDFRHSQSQSSDRLPIVSPSGRVPNKSGPLVTVLLSAKPGDTVRIDNLEVSVKVVERVLREKFHHTPGSFATLSSLEQNKMQDAIVAYISRNMNSDMMKRDAIELSTVNERTKLHISLRPWAKGPLKLEHPQGSSYHHLMQYDTVSSLNESTMSQIADKIGHPELLVVENDWATAISELHGSDVGEVRMPFAHACWEFRISGVRVLAFVRTDETTFETIFFCVYGKDNIWVADDYGYYVSGDKLDPSSHYAKMDNMEFDRVAKLVWSNIRASCIMLDAKVARGESVAPSNRLVEKRIREGRAAPRSYAVVRLLRKPSAGPRRYNNVVSVGERSPQGGHIRRGTWVHYDDPDSGREQYANNGGFVVSRTWRPWHFAGDLSRMIQREYRL